MMKVMEKAKNAEKTGGAGLKIEENQKVILEA
jgi:hypothetical protein